MISPERNVLLDISLSIAAPIISSLSYLDSRSQKKPGFANISSNLDKKERHGLVVSLAFLLFFNRGSTSFLHIKLFSLLIIHQIHHV